MSDLSSLQYELETQRPQKLPHKLLHKLLHQFNRPSWNNRCLFRNTHTALSELVVTENLWHKIAMFATSPSKVPMMQFGVGENADRISTERVSRSGLGIKRDEISNADTGK
jgi:hypothetical protein